MSLPSEVFTVWVAAWLNGRAGSDDVLDALSAWGPAHSVSGELASSSPSDLVELLTSLRRIDASVPALVLPAAGDARGLGGGGPLLAAAMDTGEAVTFTERGLGIVPAPVPNGLQWTVYPLGTVNRLDQRSLGDAEHDLSAAVRASAETLAALDVAGDRPDARAALAQRLRSAPSPGWPDGTPGRALRVLQRAEEIDAIVALATADEPGGAVSASAARHRSEALRPLTTAVREARCAAVNTAAQSFAGEHVARRRVGESRLHSDGDATGGRPGR